MEDFKLYIGEDFALAGEVIFEDGDTASSLSEFEIDLELSTTPLGRSILASTKAGAEVRIGRRDGNFFVLNVPAALTSALSPGTITLGMSLTHKTTGLRSINESKAFPLLESRIGRKV